MRKFLAAVLLIFLVAPLGAPVPAHAQSGVVTFIFRNRTPYVIHLRMFSRTRHWVWPSATTHYTLRDNGRHAARLACMVGEYICFGAGWKESDLPRYWGVGFSGTKGCQGCCLTCGTPGQNVYHGWDLSQ